MSGRAALDLVRSALSRRLGLSVEAIEPGHALADDLGLSSLDFLELRGELERAIGAPVAERRLERVRTVADVVDLVVELG